METTKLSSKGQIIIPKWLRDANQWKPGTEFVIINTGSGVLFKPSQPFPATTLEEVVGCLPYDGPPHTVEEMNEAIEIAIREQWDDRG